MWMLSTMIDRQQLTVFSKRHILSIQTDVFEQFLTLGIVEGKLRGHNCTLEALPKSTRENKKYHSPI